LNEIAKQGVKKTLLKIENKYWKKKIKIKEIRKISG